MGNTASCTPHSGGAVRIIGADGRVEERFRSVRAAELMVDNPGRFVCESSHLRVGCRIPGLAADEELERRRLYFLLPMDLLYSVLTEDELACLSARASSAAKSKTIGRRIFPVLSEFCLFPSEAKKAVEEPKVAAAAAAIGMSARDIGEASRQRSWSWRPALDTIQEADPCCL